MTVHAQFKLKFIQIVNHCFYFKFYLGRSNSPYVAVVMTDGGSDNPSATEDQANIAKDKGIRNWCCKLLNHQYGWKYSYYNITFSRTSK